MAHITEKRSKNFVEVFGNTEEDVLQQWFYWRTRRFKSGTRTEYYSVNQGGKLLTGPPDR